MKPYALRLRPGEDPKAVLESFAQDHRIAAACVLTCVGSLRKAVLRFANQEQPVTLNGYYEIVSMTGVFSTHGGHFHVAVSDGEGRTYGAHLMDGSEVYTTAEIIIAELDNFHFFRTFDHQTGYPELDIKPV